MQTVSCFYRCYFVSPLRTKMEIFQNSIMSSTGVSCNFVPPKLTWAHYKHIRFFSTGCFECSFCQNITNDIQRQYCRGGVFALSKWELLGYLYESNIYISARTAMQQQGKMSINARIENMAVHWIGRIPHMAVCCVSASMCKYQNHQPNTLYTTSDISRKE